jgi:hypothetical protein
MDIRHKPYLITARHSVIKLTRPGRLSRIRQDAFPSAGSRTYPITYYYNL